MIVQCKAGANMVRYYSKLRTYPEVHGPAVLFENYTMLFAEVVESQILMVQNNTIALKIQWWAVGNKVR